MLGFGLKLGGAFNQTHLSPDGGARAALAGLSAHDSNRPESSPLEVCVAGEQIGIGVNSRRRRRSRPLSSSLCNRQNSAAETAIFVSSGTIVAKHREAEDAFRDAGAGLSRRAHLTSSS